MNKLQWKEYWRNERLKNKSEIWKDVPWYEWKYFISDLWNIKSYRKELNPYKNKYWYKQTILIKWRSQKKTFLIHRLVLLAFLQNPEKKEQVNHINWIKIDNRLINLEWCTHSENQLHRRRVLKH